MLDDAKELSLILHKYKLDEGYVDFEISEPKIKLNTDGSVKEIQINERGFSEVLIEDFMVRTNETVAKYLYDQKLPVLYRVKRNTRCRKVIKSKKYFRNSRYKFRGIASKKLHLNLLLNLLIMSKLKEMTILWN
ncbi:ribonuclease catalytic domain-containing protein [Mycoplasmopsis felis]|uniref:ribonuclease catalytic domain-containing protein n=1 Tax=Mycoplasmopsis felis TaxID=33923 RepID=UPI0021B0763F|nr:ribonuclease catalytic domain-containing protein [Mycoplasmopsis felis]UWV79252.1 ribonuclease catalytic domain-containing protein [Mycoplasmopsis felis]